MRTTCPRAGALSGKSLSRTVLPRTQTAACFFTSSSLMKRPSLNFQTRTFFISGLVPTTMVMQLRVRVEIGLTVAWTSASPVVWGLSWRRRLGAAAVVGGLGAGGRAVLGARAGRDDDQRLADVVEPFVELLPCAAAGRHHRDDRPGADDDAEAG